MILLYSQNAELFSLSKCPVKVGSHKAGGKQYLLRRDVCLYFDETILKTSISVQAYLLYFKDQIQVSRSQEVRLI